MIRELERRTLELWPPAERLHDDGWVLATGGGYTRRINSIQPLGIGRRELCEKIERGRLHFEERGLRPVFKLTVASEPAGLDEELDALGYRRASESCVLVHELSARRRTDAGAGSGVEIDTAFDDAWLAACVALNHVVEAHRPALRDTLERLPRGSAFARIREGERTVALALGSLADGHVYLGEVVTDTERRRSGLARQLLEATLHWARERGAHRAFLAVEADNAPARALYEGLGFREAYRYWYREAAHAASPD